MNTSELRLELMKTMHRFRRLNVSGSFGPLTRSEYFAIETIDRSGRHNARQGVYVSKLAETLEVSPPAVSRMLRNMEQSGWIERQVEQSDRRNITVTVTPQGMQAKQRTEEQMKSYSDNVMKAMGVPEMTTLLQLWNQLIGVMEQENDKQKKGDRPC